MERATVPMTANSPKRGPGRPRKTNDAGVIDSPEGFASREQQFEDEDKAREADRLNHNFFMVYREAGAPALRRLIRKNAVAGELFVFLAEQMDRTGSLVASGVALAAALGVSQPTISRAIKVLVEDKYVIRFNSGGAHVFCLNPDYVWAAWRTAKKTAMFHNAKVLMARDEQDLYARRHLNMLMAKQAPSSGRDIDPETGEIFDSQQTHEEPSGGLQ
jgi:hypothetical protein